MTAAGMQPDEFLPSGNERERETVSHVVVAVSSTVRYITGMTTGAVQYNEGSVEPVLYTILLRGLAQWCSLKVASNMLQLSHTHNISSCSQCVFKTSGTKLESLSFTSDTVAVASFKTVDGTGNGAKFRRKLLTSR